MVKKVTGLWILFCCVCCGLWAQSMAEVKEMVQEAENKYSLYSQDTSRVEDLQQVCSLYRRALNGSSRMVRYDAQHREEATVIAAFCAYGIAQAPSADAHIDNAYAYFQTADSDYTFILLPAYLPDVVNVGSRELTKDEYLKILAKTDVYMCYCASVFNNSHKTLFYGMELVHRHGNGVLGMEQATTYDRALRAALALQDDSMVSVAKAFFYAYHFNAVARDAAMLTELRSVDSILNKFSGHTGKTAYRADDGTLHYAAATALYRTAQMNRAYQRAKNATALLAGQSALYEMYLHARSIEIIAGSRSGDRKIAGECIADFKSVTNPTAEEEEAAAQCYERRGDTQRAAELHRQAQANQLHFSLP